MNTQPPPLPQLGPVRQLGYVVDDLDRWMQAMTTQLGLGPWTVFRNVTLNATFRGEAVQPVIDVAMAYSGELQIELIQAKDDGPSPYAHFVARKQFGLHHSAFLCADIDADARTLKAAGMQLMCEIVMPSGMGRYIYFESAEFGDGYFIELLEATPMMRNMIGAGVAAAAHLAPTHKIEFNTAFWLGLMRRLRFWK